MQIIDRVKNCNGCAACVVACKYNCVKMHDRNEPEIQALIDGKQPLEGTKKIPLVNDGGCQRCNACVLYCPLFNPLELPEFDGFYEYDESFESRDLPPHYREVMRNVRAGKRVEFVATLCEIAALQALLGDLHFDNLIYRPMYCDDEKRMKEPACMKCKFYEEI